MMIIRSTETSLLFTTVFYPQDPGEHNILPGDGDDNVLPEGEGHDALHRVGDNY